MSAGVYVFIEGDYRSNPNVEVWTDSDALRSSLKHRFPKCQWSKVRAPSDCIAMLYDPTASYGLSVKGYVKSVALHGELPERVVIEVREIYPDDPVDKMLAEL